MLPDDRDFGPAMARLTQRQRIFVDLCSAASSRLRRRVEPATAIAGTLRRGPHGRDENLRRTYLTGEPVNDHRHCVAGVTEWRRWSCAVMGLFGTEKPLALHEI
jgi:hypothetical protein